MQFVFIFVGEVGGFDFLHDADDEIASADERIEDVDTFIAEGAAKFFLEDFFDAANHEIDDGLRRVDDAVGIGFFGGVALEKALVDFVQEGLFLGEAGGFLGAALDGFVETVKSAQEFVAIEGAASELGDDLFDFGGDHVAASEIGIVENFAEDALGE